MTERFVERIWPYVATPICVAMWWFIGAPFPKPAGPLLGGALTAIAVLVGFLATAKAIMLSVAASPVFKSLKETGFTSPLFSYMFEALWAGIAFLVFSVVGFFIDSADRSLPIAYTAIWMAGGTLAVFLYARITRILFLLLSRV